MAFLDDSPDLSGYRYGPHDLQRAREYLLSALNKHAPGWLQAPRGTLALHWRAGGPYPACFIIRIAQILHTLDRSITEKSVSVLREKFGILLRSSDAQFDEMLTELEIASALVERFSPISLEPLVGKDTPTGAKPPSPDFALRLPEGDVCIEATVLRVRLLDQWDREAAWLSGEISRLAKKRRLSASVELRLPIDFSKRDLSEEAFATLLDTVAAAPMGEGKLATRRGSGSFAWTPVSVFSFGPDGLTESMPPATLPDGVAHVMSVSWHPVMSEEVSERVLDSLRNSLDRKRDQRIFEGPYLIAIKLGHHRIASEGIKALLEQRIWPNEQYGGISGIIHYTPPFGFGAADPSHSLSLQPNFRARVPIPASIVSGFEGTAKFHLP